MHNASGCQGHGGWGMPREETKIEIAVIVRYLRGGKSPKEIAYIMQRPYETIRKMIQRYQEIRSVYVESYALRYPEKTMPPMRLRELN